MRIISEDLADHLSGGVTTLCRCVRLTRKDGVVIGFTDHDRTLGFDGTIFTPRDGIGASAAASEVGFAVAGLELDGVLSSAGLKEKDLLAGLYDGAAIELFLVNFEMPDQRLLEGRGTVGEVRLTDETFTAEVRGPLQALEKRKGRVFGALCDADLGDARCKVDLALSANRHQGAIVSIDSTSRLLLAPGTIDEGRLTGGLMRVLDGAAEGFSAGVRYHERTASGEAIELDARLPPDLLPGDPVRVTAGCDKRFSTCAARFFNAANFRGFPHMPGNDMALGYRRSRGA